MIGEPASRLLEENGHEVVRFDLANGQSILDPDRIREAIHGCHAVIHLAASLGEENEPASSVMAVNLLGTWHVLAAAAQARVERVVFFSSVEVLGIFRGERKPDYLPLDDAHSCHPAAPYAISKHLAEQMCRLWTESTGIPTICLRLPGVFDAQTYEFIISRRRADPDFEWHPFWQYGAFLDLRDAAQAAQCALSCPISGHVTLLLCADDISSSSQTSRELAQFIQPDVEWRGAKEYQERPYKALVINDRAKEILNWTPRHKWRP